MTVSGHSVIFQSFESPFPNILRKKRFLAVTIFLPSQICRRPVLVHGPAVEKN
jgi:hypothetical protein